MVHILVTGGAGFIGSHLVEALLDDGCRVTALDNFDPFYDRAQKEQNLAACWDRPHFRMIEADLCDPAAWTDRAHDRYDAIVHLAARAGVRPSIANPMQYQRVNVQGTQTLLEFARSARVPHFVFASSSSVYGVNPRMPWSEGDPVLKPISPYASTKVSGELLGHVYSHVYGLRFIALRLFTAYGPRQRPDLAIHKFARAMLRGEAITVYGDGATSRDYTYVKDIVSGLVAAIGFSGSRYEVINLGNNRTVTIAETIRALESALGLRARVEWLPEQPGDVPRTWANVDKARQLLQYNPATPFAEGIDQFIRWFQSADMLSPMPANERVS